MKFLAFAPYALIILGLGLSLTGLRPAALSWGIAVLGALSGLVIALIFVFSSRDGGWLFAAIAFLPFFVAVVMVVKALSYPRINDITTDVDNPPPFVAALKAPASAGRKMTLPSSWGKIIGKAYPDLQALVLEETPEQAFQRAKQLAETQSGWRITHVDESQGLIEAEASTRFFRFIDDVVVRVSGEGNKAHVDMRSKSREGRSDLGKNAQRIRAFLKQL